MMTQADCSAGVVGQQFYYIVLIKLHNLLLQFYSFTTNMNLHLHSAVLLHMLHQGTTFTELLTLIFAASVCARPAPINDQALDFFFLSQECRISENLYIPKQLYNVIHFCFNICCSSLYKSTDIQEAVYPKTTIQCYTLLLQYLLFQFVQEY